MQRWDIIFLMFLLYVWLDSYPNFHGEIKAAYIESNFFQFNCGYQENECALFNILNKEIIIQRTSEEIFHFH